MGMREVQILERLEKFLCGEFNDIKGVDRKELKSVAEIGRHLERLSGQVHEVKSMIEKFLQPSIVILIGNDIARRIKMKDNEKATASIAEVDAKGFPVDNPKAFDVAPAWAIDDPTVATLAPSDDGTTCDVIAVKPGSAQLTVAGKIDGVEFASPPATVLVTSGDAVSISIKLGDAVAQ